jgi:hypothetical protein
MYWSWSRFFLRFSPFTNHSTMDPLSCAIAFTKQHIMTPIWRPHTNCVKTSIKTWDKRDKSWCQHHECSAVFIITFVSTVFPFLRHVADIVSWLLHVLTHSGVFSSGALCLILHLAACKARKRVLYQTVRMQLLVLKYSNRNGFSWHRVDPFQTALEHGDS